MQARPEPLRRLDRYFAAATIAHEYIADLHRELTSLQEDSEHTRALLRESADMVTRAMPELTNEIHHLEREWIDDTLDPPKAERTLQLMQARLEEVEPELSGLRQRQNEIAEELSERVKNARGR